MLVLSFSTWSLIGKCVKAIENAKCTVIPRLIKVYITEFAGVLTGDHSYKQTEGLPPEEQMITALPDVRTLMIDPAEDEFMVLACDGIWNFMSSQDVVDFVRERIQKGETKLSKICEEVINLAFYW